MLLLLLLLFVVVVVVVVAVVVVVVIVIVVVVVVVVIVILFFVECTGIQNSNSTIYKATSNNISLGINEGSNVIVIEVPDSNNSFVVGRLVYMPNYSSYVVSGNVVAKNSNTSANVTLLYVTNATGTFTS